MIGKNVGIPQQKTHGKRSERGDFFKNGELRLSDGKKFEGIVPAWQKTPFIGEVVFNTGMSGYVESLTDPSYAGEILVFTYPLIGNYGVDPTSGESPKIQAAGVVVSEAALHYSHSTAQTSFLAWLEDQGIPILIDADTRAITKHLRVRGTMMGAICGTELKSPVSIPKKNEPFFVSIDEPINYGKSKAKTVILVDCGAKENIVRSLQQYSLHVKRVPFDYDYTKEAYDAIFLSNGPGDPTDYQQTIEIARKAMKVGKPMFGICLGTQIMALAAGAKTYKLLYGHRGHNQPCMEQGSERCFITSQNHGYAIDEKSLPKGWEVWFRNLNDNSVEGIRHKTKPFSSVQFHPEACPGPTDTAWLFERFYKSL